MTGRNTARLEVWIEEQDRLDRGHAEVRIGQLFFGFGPDMEMKKLVGTKPPKHKTPFMGDFAGVVSENSSTNLADSYYDEYRVLRPTPHGIALKDSTIARFHVFVLRVSRTSRELLLRFFREAADQPPRYHSKPNLPLCPSDAENCITLTARAMKKCGAVDDSFGSLRESPIPGSFVKELHEFQRRVGWVRFYRRKIVRPRIMPVGISTERSPS